MHAKAIEIAWHDNSPIWSVDISTHNRVVTASGDKVARLWRFHSNPHSVLHNHALASSAATSATNPLKSATVAHQQHTVSHPPTAPVTVAPSPPAVGAVTTTVSNSITSPSTTPGAPSSAMNGTTSPTTATEIETSTTCETAIPTPTPTPTVLTATNSTPPMPPTAPTSTPPVATPATTIAASVAHTTAPISASPSTRQLAKLAKLSAARLDTTLVEWLCDLRAHATTINVARFSPDGRTVATAADHGEIVLWRLDDRPDAQPSPLALAAAGATSAAPSPTPASSSALLATSGGGSGVNGSGLPSAIGAVAASSRSPSEDGGGMVTEREKEREDDDAPRERWCCHGTLRGHLQDVLDLAWSADSCRLVSASVDNAVMVWDVNNPTRTPIALRHHNNFVQGVSIDPIGRLIASMGNDRALRVFTANAAATSWIQVSSISSLGSADARLFVDDSRFKNFFRRLAWSPDGSVLACPSGMHLPKESKRLFAVHVFARNQWNTPVVQCGGLPTPPCVVRFSPLLYRLRRPQLSSSIGGGSASVATYPTQQAQAMSDIVGDMVPFGTFSYRMVFAVACVHSVLFYDTECISRPFAVVEGLHCAEHTDLTWSADGRTVLVSAVDGYISAITFSEGDLGTPLTTAEMPPWLNDKREEVLLALQLQIQQSQQKARKAQTTTVVRPKLTTAKVATGMEKKRPIEAMVAGGASGVIPCQSPVKRPNLAAGDMSSAPRESTKKASAITPGYRITPPGPPNSAAAGVVSVPKADVDIQPAKGVEHDVEMMDVGESGNGDSSVEFVSAMPGKVNGVVDGKVETMPRNVNGVNEVKCAATPVKGIGVNGGKAGVSSSPTKKGKPMSGSTCKRRNKNGKVQTKLFFSSKPGGSTPKVGIAVPIQASSEKQTDEDCLVRTPTRGIGEGEALEPKASMTQGHGQGVAKDATQRILELT